ncbi:MAG TPA: hypothetical protein VKQ11_06850 [Candidatus Sulfotelmatobacter sp.]|nr:hypothetical protein [Candidatus Sulfotelmatobacter sp.]
MRGIVRSIVAHCGLLAAICIPGFCQSAVTDPSSSDTGAAVQSPAPAKYTDPGRVGVGVKVSLLGAGAEAAVRVTHHTNVRAGFNMINYNRTFDKDGISYAGQLSFKTFEAHYDYFPWARSFHISPGVLVYAGDPITATASVPANQSFTLGGVQYYSDPTNPVTGTGKIDFNKAAPMITVGWGNLVSRKEGKHFTVPFELGVAFQGSPKATLGLAGNVCDSPGGSCRSAATDPNVQSNVISEQNKVNNSMSFFKAYPIISLGFGYKF